MKTSLTPAGYPIVSLSLNGIQNRYTVHSLVARAFLGPRPTDFHIDHKNANKTDASVSNLEYVTSKENHRRAKVMGLYPSGDRHGSRLHPHTRPRGMANAAAIYTDGKVRAIKIDYALKKRSYSEMASRHGVTKKFIADIVTGKTWRHIKLETDL